MSSISEIIIKKRDGHALSAEEINFFIQGLQDDSVADYQASAFLMAAYFQGMNLNETVALTQAMVNSGEQYDLSDIPGSKVDKHSTGGVGDKVSLVLAPLAAACGLKVPMMSGRGLGHTGGTLDKLEAISGFQVQLSRSRFEKILRQVGVVMIGQSQSMTPADKKLYALRDVTGTVESAPLIAASILSKKIAEGSRALILDIKAGNGAFMKNTSSAKQLARLIMQVAKKMKLPMRAVVSNMDQPLGYTVGHSLEVIEAIELLSGKRYLNSEAHSGDLKEVTIHLCAHMLVLGKLYRNMKEARKIAIQKLQDGSAYQVFQQMVTAQGGQVEQVQNPNLLPLSSHIQSWKAKKSGFLVGMDTQHIGHLLIEMGGGRKQVSDNIDPGVGLVLHKKLGSKINTGETLATAYLPSKKGSSSLENLFHQSIHIRRGRKNRPTLVTDISVS